MKVKIMPALKITFKWVYTPANYFDQRIEYEINGWNIQLYNGCAQAVVQTQESVTKHPMLRNKINDEIDRQFFAQQLLKHGSYELSYDRMEEENSEGERNVVIEAEATVLTILGMSAEITITNKDGNITYDSRRDRKQREQGFRNKIVEACRHDPLSKHLMDSYKASVNEPENELVRLYEIRDALAKHYGSDHHAKSRLSISNTKWSQFGKICNVEPLNQGRHKGQHIGSLRNATDAELQEAREITLALLDAHFDVVISIQRP